MEIMVDFGSYHLNNLGDLAMLQVGLSRLKKLWPSLRPIVYTEETNLFRKKFHQAFPINPIGRNLYFREGIFFPGLSFFPWFIANRLIKLENYIRGVNPNLTKNWINFRYYLFGAGGNHIREFYMGITSVDAIVCTGGGYFTDHFSSHAITVLRMIRFAKNHGKPVALFSQGIGPIKSPKLLRLMKEVFPLVDLICLRESRTGLPLLLSFGIDSSKVIVTGDDAIELAYSYRMNEREDFIGLNIRQAYYSGFIEDEIRAICMAVIDFAQKKNVSILPIPISLVSKESDIETLSRYISFENLLLDVSAIDTPERVNNLISHCRVVITGSYHAGLFALSQGIPVIGLAKSEYYRYKFEGLADQFGCGCEIVNIGEPDFLDQLSILIDQFWEFGYLLYEPLLRAAKNQIFASHEAYLRFLEIVCKSNSNGSNQT